MSSSPVKASVLFVCIGNICRSPTAEGIFQSLVNKAGLANDILVDSAGMSGYHIGERAHSTSREAASKRGYELNSRARQFHKSDFTRFDYILPMDESNIPILEKMAGSEEDKKKILPFIQLVKSHPEYTDVPDPYYGGADGFEHVLDICEEGCEALLEKIKNEKL